MKILVITSPQEMRQEVETIHELFQAGLEILHLRKPDYNKTRIEELLQNIDTKYHRRIMLHSHHNLGLKYGLRGLHFPVSVRQESNKLLHPLKSTSCHSINELEGCGSHFEYLMVSPVFDSISKPGYYAGINTRALEQFIECSGSCVVGLGGVTPKTLQQLPNNCWGAAVLGCIWCHDSVRNRLRSFEKLIAGAERR